jgi:Gpi18-like mannosyltransferase
MISQVMMNRLMDAEASLTIPPQPYLQAEPPLRTTWRPLGLWLCLAVLFDIVCATNSGFEPDIQYWVRWSRHLLDFGYADLVADYPPIFVHWLALAGQLERLLGVEPALNGLIRFLAVTPVIICHVILLCMVDGALRRSHASERSGLGIMALVVFNPALLMDGPIWGQVDLLFIVPMVAAFALLVRGKAVFWAFPLLTVAVLTKFQAICLGAALLPLLWHRRGGALFAGLLASIPMAFVIVLPYVMDGSLGTLIDKAYLGAASSYPVASLNAANVWYLIGMNEVEGARAVFDHTVAASGWRVIFAPRYLGLVLYAAWCLWLVVDGVRTLEAARHWRNAILCVIGFFFLLPAMHERYMLPAAVLALLAAGHDRRFVWHAIVLSLLVAANMVAIMKPGGGGLLYVLAFLVLAAAAVMIAGDARFVEGARWLGRGPVWAWAVGAVVIWGTALTIHTAQARREADVAMAQHVARGWIEAAQLSGRRAVQGWGDLQIDKSVGGNPLRIGGVPYPKGMGTHARSTITLIAPPLADRLTGRVGMDDEEAEGRARFEIRVDGKSVWSSTDMVTGMPAQAFDINVRGARRVQLLVDPLGPIDHDHADWVDTRFTFAAKK